MLEISPVRAALFHCLASDDVLERVEQASGLLSARIASDEVLVVGSVGIAAGTLEQLMDIARRLDPSHLFLDQSAGYAGFRLSGGGETVAFARLSQLPLDEHRPTFLQGLVAHVSAKVFATEDSITIFVSSIVDHFVANRISAACADLDITWKPATDYSIPSSGSLHW